MQIEIIDPDPQVNTELFKDIIEHIFTSEHITSEFVNVVFVEQEKLRSLKKQYFDLDRYTDVIAFNLNDKDEPIEGEIYLSLEQIILNASHYKIGTANELHRVLIHGCLHLCGYEDDTVEHKVTMTALEDHYLTWIKDLKV